ncbi:MAG: CcmD family protein [Ignavibacteria bacterium]|nr:CcmD family protein [Ignavibacteria bacterium]
MDFIWINQTFIVLGITLILWIGLFFYMLSVDMKIKKIEKE